MFVGKPKKLLSMEFELVKSEQSLQKLNVVHAIYCACKMRNDLDFLNGFAICDHVARILIHVLRSHTCVLCSLTDAILNVHRAHVLQQNDDDRAGCCCYFRSLSGYDFSGPSYVDPLSSPALEAFHESTGSLKMI